ncbi:MAG: hypothetical protein ACYDEY_13745 [Acidimicrobiales bacterium]
MTLFKKRKPTSLVPRDVLGLLESYGKYAYDSLNQRAAGMDPRFVDWSNITMSGVLASRSAAGMDPRFVDWSNFMFKVFGAWKIDATGTIAEIHSSTLGNQYARFGGYKALMDIGGDMRDPLFLELMDEWINMVRARNLSSGYLTGYESKRWIELHGDLRTTFDRIVEVETPCEPLQVGIELKPGQSIMVAKLGPDRLDNEFYIERIDSGTYGAYSMRPHDSDATELSRSEEEFIPKADSLGAVLKSIGQMFRLPTYWSHDDLKPYFTERRNV